jgi:hypothetical protein
VVDRASMTIAQFGRFRVDSHRREFLADGIPVPIGSSAFDILIVLIEARRGVPVFLWSRKAKIHPKQPICQLRRRI